MIKTRPAPDLLARPAVCGHPTSMILTRAPSRAPFTPAVKITLGPQTCSRAPVGSPASEPRLWARWGKPQVSHAYVRRRSEVDGGAKVRASGYGVFAEGPRGGAFGRRQRALPSVFAEVPRGGAFIHRQLTSASRQRQAKWPRRCARGLRTTDEDDLSPDC